MKINKRLKPNESSKVEKKEVMEKNMQNEIKQ